LKNLWFIPALLLLALGASPQPLRADSLTLEVFTGDAYNFPTALTVRQSGYPDINLTAHYDTEAFGPYTPYYAIRLALWDKNQAWEFEQVHHRLFLTNPPPEIQNFSIHYGYSFFMLGHAWKLADYVLHIDAGVIIASPENTVRGQTLYTSGTGLFDWGYYLSGVGAQAAVSRSFDIAGPVFITLEGAFMAGYATVPVVNGSADVPNLSLHGRFGTGVKF
jgi:hypothetical protein